MTQADLAPVENLVQSEIHPLIFVALTLFTGIDGLEKVNVTLHEINSSRHGNIYEPHPIQKVRVEGIYCVGSMK